MEKAIFVDLLKKKIKDANYKQEDFAKEIGIAYSTLKKYLTLKNETLPDLEILSRMCDVLKCDADYLMGKITEETHDAKHFKELTGIDETGFTTLCQVNNQWREMGLPHSLNMMMCHSVEFWSLLNNLSIMICKGEVAAGYNGWTASPTSTTMFEDHIAITDEFIAQKKYTLCIEELKKFILTNEISPKELDHRKHYLRIMGKSLK